MQLDNKSTQLSTSKPTPPTIIIEKDASPEEISQALIHATVYDSNGNPICGQKRHYTHSICKKVAGWGTDHFGYGSCKDHDLEKQADVIYLDVVNDEEISDYIKNYSQNRDALANNDNELVVAKALLMTRLAKLQSSEIDTEVGRVTFLDVQKTLALIDRMLLTKNELQKTTKDMISRIEVIGYLEKAKMILQQELRNHCPKCNHVHGMQDKVLQKLARIGQIGM